MSSAYVADSNTTSGVIHAVSKQILRASEVMVAALIPTLPRMLNSGELCQVLGTATCPIDRSTLHRWERADPTFPKPVKFFKDRRWFADEIEAWIRSHPRRVYCNPKTDAQGSE